MSWPTTTDAELLLIDMGFRRAEPDGSGGLREVCSIGPSVLRPTLAAEAVARIEAATGFKPLIAPAEPSAVKFDAPEGGMRLFIKRALCEVTGVSVLGTALTEGADYWVYTLNGQVSAIEFRLLPVSRRPQCIEVTGRWGRFLEVPDALRGIAVRVMAGLAVIQFREGVKAQPVRWQEGDVSESYGEAMLKDAGEGLVESALAEARAYCYNAGAWF